MKKPLFLCILLHLSCPSAAEQYEQDPPLFAPTNSTSLNVYDSNHNVIEERIDELAPIYRSYSSDGLNNKLTESDRPNKMVQYSYVPGTTLLSSELVKLYGAIVKRTFHFYDLELPSICVMTICDDGKSEDPFDLQGITFRYVTEIAPKRTLPCVGLPEEVRDYAGDRLLKKVRYTYHSSGKIASEEHFDSYNQHRYTIKNLYDRQERLIQTNDPLGHPSYYIFDDNFNLTAKLGPHPDQHIEWCYDCANRLLQQCEWQSDGSVLISEQKYDENSHLIATIDPSGFETSYSYDPLGRLIAIHHPDGAVETKEYDSLGNVILEIDPKGYETRKSYNAQGKPIAIFHPDGTEEHFSYYPEGGMVASHIDRHGVKTTYTYDLLDHLIRTETATAISTASYSPFKLLSETDPMGVTTTISYDLAGRKICEQIADREISYLYNELGQLCQIQEGELVTSFSYDLKGQLLEKKIDSHIQESYTYDPAGNKITTTTCAGTTTTLFNTRGEPIQIKDPSGMITEISYTYPRGLSQYLRNPDGITQETLHDSRKRPILLQQINKKGECIQKEERKYDAAGNLTESILTLFQDPTISQTIKTEWAYGPGNRLEKIIEEGEQITQYVYDSAGRLATLIKPDGRSIHRIYDSAGRLARYYGDGIDYSYTYDAKNQIVQIADHLNKTTLEPSCEELAPSGLSY